MATIALPSGGVKISVAKAGYQRAQGVAQCPYSLQTLVQDYGGKARVIEVSVPPISTASASAWTEFFDLLSGSVNTFNLNISEIWPHETGTVAFRLADPNFSWDASAAKYFGFSFKAIEVL